MMGDLDHCRDRLAQYTRAFLSARKRTIWDARSLLRPYRGQWVDMVVDGGALPEERRSGIYMDVLHGPHQGLLLKLRSFTNSREGSRFWSSSRRDMPLDERRKFNWTTDLPVRSIRWLPEPFSFLLKPREEWPLPESFLRCSYCGSDGETGRFCTSCGRKIRKGYHLGEGFSAQQSALRRMLEEGESYAFEHDCGGMACIDFSSCPKCGDEVQVWALL